jgi:hypothetical protein
MRRNPSGVCLLEIPSRAHRLVRLTLLAFSVAVGGVACAQRISLPTGAGVLQTDDTVGGAAYLEDGSRRCGDTQTLTAQIDFRGWVAGHDMRRRLWVGAGFPALVRIESNESAGAPTFVFTADGDEAMLYLPSDDRVIRGERAAVLAEVVVGIPLTSVDLEGLLTGCPRIGGSLDVRMFGNRWMRVGVGDDEFFYRRTDSNKPWLLTAMIRRIGDRGLRWRVEYAGYREHFPRSIRLASVEWNGQVGRSFDLRLSLDQVQFNPRLGPALFKVEVPSSARPTTIDELRRIGRLTSAPLAAERSHR